jgi:hypothetical protein
MTHICRIGLQLALALAMAGAPALSSACSEGMFSSGKGLAFQSYLAPRPAHVLIYSTAADGDADPLHAGLQKAGHTLTIVRDADALASALDSGHYDIVIAAVDDAEQVATNVRTGAGAPALLPIVARGTASAASLRERFGTFVFDGASLGQYLTVINRVIGSRAN